MRKQERNLRIYELHKAGQTFEALGQQFGISKSRAQRICGDIENRREWAAQTADERATLRVRLSELLDS